MIGDLAEREDELGGKTLLIVGLGRIGGRLARLAKAFDMRVIGLRRDPAAGRGAADAVHRMDELKSLLPEADFVALTCPLTKETENLIDAEALGRMKPSAHLVNVARGRVVDEAALVEALAARRIAGAGIDVTAEEPLAPNSPLWGMPHVLITPHTAGETRRYEDNVIEILRDNLGRLWRGEAAIAQPGGLRLTTGFPSTSSGAIVIRWSRSRFSTFPRSPKAATPDRRCATRSTWRGMSRRSATGASGWPSTTTCPASPARRPRWRSPMSRPARSTSGSAPAASCCRTTRRW